MRHALLLVARLQRVKNGAGLQDDRKLPPPQNVALHLTTERCSKNGGDADECVAALQADNAKFLCGGAKFARLVDGYVGSTPAAARPTASRRSTTFLARAANRADAQFVQPHLRREIGRMLWHALLLRRPIAGFEIRRGRWKRVRRGGRQYQSPKAPPIDLAARAALQRGVHPTQAGVRWSNSN